MVSEALSCILNYKNFLGDAPIPPQQEGAHPLSYSPPRLRRSGSCLWHGQFSQFLRYRYFPNLVDKITGGIILNLDQLFRKCRLKIFLSIALLALLFSAAKPFVQFWTRASCIHTDTIPSLAEVPADPYFQ